MLRDPSTPVEGGSTTLRQGEGNWTLERGSDSISWNYPPTTLNRLLGELFVVQPEDVLSWVHTAVWRMHRDDILKERNNASQDPFAMRAQVVEKARGNSLAAGGQGLVLGHSQSQSALGQSALGPSVSHVPSGSNFGTQSLPVAPSTTSVSGGTAANSGVGPTTSDPTTNTAEESSPATNGTNEPRTPTVGGQSHLRQLFLQAARGNLAPPPGGLAMPPGQSANGPMTPGRDGMQPEHSDESQEGPTVIDGLGLNLKCWPENSAPSANVEQLHALRAKGSPGSADGTSGGSVAAPPVSPFLKAPGPRIQPPVLDSDPAFMHGASHRSLQPVGEEPMASKRLQHQLDEVVRQSGVRDVPGDESQMVVHSKSLVSMFVGAGHHATQSFDSGSATSTVLARIRKGTWESKGSTHSEPGANTRPESRYAQGSKRTLSFLKTIRLTKDYSQNDEEEWGEKRSEESNIRDLPHWMDHFIAPTGSTEVNLEALALRTASRTFKSSYEEDIGGLKMAGFPQRTWDMLYGIALIFELWAAPFSLMFLPEDEPTPRWLEIMFGIVFGIFCADLLLYFTFCIPSCKESGYLHHDWGSFLLGGLLRWKWFPVDLLAILPHFVLYCDTDAPREWRWVVTVRDRKSVV